MKKIIHVVDGIIHYHGGVVLVDRKKEPFGLALPGGKLKSGETLEEAIAREVREETNLKIRGLRQFKTYSDPNRDPRFRAISTTFIANGYGKLGTGSDAKETWIFGLEDIDLIKEQFAFDHYKILSDYRNLYFQEMRERMR